MITNAKINVVIAALILLCCAAISGCGKAVLKDGVFTGASGADDKGDYGEVRVTIAAGKVTDCSFVTWQKDGTPKAADYGKVNGEIANQAYYDKAQLAVRAMAAYAKAYAAAGDLKAVDVVSGATIAYNQFQEAIAEALAQAVK
jgi:major membrane immunogen (membrane-anchored lipoprotein)